MGQLARLCDQRSYGLVVQGLDESTCRKSLYRVEEPVAVA